MDSEMMIVSMSMHLSLPIAIHWLIHGGGVSEQPKDWAVPFFSLPSTVRAVIRCLQPAAHYQSTQPTNCSESSFPKQYHRSITGRPLKPPSPLGLLQKLLSRPNLLVAAASLFF